MTSDDFLELNSNSMFTCTHYKNPCKLTYAECVRRQKAIKSSGNPTPGYVQRPSGGSVYDYTPCLKCQQGRENRDKTKKMGKIVKVEVPGKFEEDQVKTCPCGQKFTYPKGTRRHTWEQMKFCEHHRVMSQHARKKDIARIKAGKPATQDIDILKTILEESMDIKPVVKIDSDGEIKGHRVDPIDVHRPETKTVNFAIKNESEFLPEDEGITWKKCVECGTGFPRGETIDSTWERKLYCGPDCRKKVENRTKTKRRTETRRAIKETFTPAKAQEVARVKWDSLSELLSAYVHDPDALNSIRAAAIKIGVDCYQQAIHDLGGLQ